VDLAGRSHSEQYAQQKTSPFHFALLLFISAVTPSSTSLLPRHQRRHQACFYLEEPRDRAVLPSSTYGKPAMPLLNAAPRGSTGEGSWWPQHCRALYWQNLDAVNRKMNLFTY